MESDLYFERLCNDVYGYYGMLRNVDPKKHALVMLRSMGEFWTERDLEKAFSERPEGQKFLNFTEFRRLAKSKWYEPAGGDQLEGGAQNDDGYGNEIFMHPEDVSRFKGAFDRVSEFYTGARGPNRTLPLEVLHNMMTNQEQPMPKPVASYFMSKLNVYNNEVTARSLLCLLAKREAVHNVM
ncbi:conserved hypothetical protein [Theileria orientalis strain Shintoku]|uniref:Uncharacterized protein n=1 Tax=Theileria orientalis strain Shintoku TaxID=869250 RepID=J4C2T4_THEOR|nr:conserved hypothetical protein [Theileria orientalis strain Shintoku]PVC50737.1 hypothetical protein MACL_00002047 [Theileria orientalis]BAM39246.1 conserved hypothetical protein [Theileria orientalis strain Shintoku]|eukprot:XP_009689547.1 conserved hypothetical protein [Theileria orientalis strain Shintoku]